MGQGPATIRIPTRGLERLGSAWLSDLVSVAAAVVLLVVLVVVVAATTPLFHQPVGVLDVLVDMWIYALPAVGLSIVMATGRMDLSSASMGFLGAALAGKLALAGLPLLPGFVVAALLAAVIGALGGALASISRPASFVVTLATAGLGQAFASLFVGARPVSLPGGGDLAPLLIPGVLLALLGCALGVIGLLSPAGSWLRWLGTDGEVRPSRLALVGSLMAAYACSAVLAAGGGVLQLARLHVVAPVNLAGEVELLVVLAAIAGGASLRGGRGGGYGAIVGGLAVAVLRNGLDAANAGLFVSLVVMGAALALAVAWDELRARLLPAG